MSNEIIFSAPSRVDLSGGAADMFGFSTLSVAIDLRAQVSISDYSHGIFVKIDETEEIISKKTVFGTETDIIKSIVKRFNIIDKKFKITVRTEIPKFSGLGGSASITVAAIASLNKKFGIGLNAYQIAEHAQRCESLELGMRNGYQDWYVAAFGGTLFMEFKNKNNLEIDQEPFAVIENLRDFMEIYLVVAHTGVKHSSDVSNERLYSEYIKGNKKIVDLIRKLDVLTRDARDAVIWNDLNLLAEIVNENQEIIRKFNRSSEENEKLIKIALSNGAIAAKVTGAGCGGCIAALCENKKDKESVTKALRESSSFVHECEIDEGVKYGI
jgi:galactokinase/mevalonate kinase-like predicted kinase